MRSKITTYRDKTFLGVVHDFGCKIKDKVLIDESIKCAMPKNYIYFLPNFSKNSPSRIKNKEISVKVSILCGTYNHESYIDRALSGFFQQKTNFFFEVIISDDRSTDKTFDKLLFWKNKYPENIKIIKLSKNIYQSSGRRPIEILLAEAKGEYIALCEGDDFWVDHNKLQMQVDILDQYPSLISTTHNFFKFDTSKMELKEHYKTGPPKLDHQREILRMQRLFWYPTLMFRNKFSVLPREWFASYMGDYILTSYLGNFGSNLLVTDFFGSIQLQNPFSTWTPLDEQTKNLNRLRSRYAILFMNERLKNRQAIDDCKHICKLFEDLVSKQEAAEIKEDCLKVIEIAKDYKVSDLDYEIV